MRVRADRLILAALVLAVVVLGLLALRPLEPRDPSPAGAPAAEFSAGRARADVRAIAARPHPTGSDAARAVRAHIVERLRGLGLAPRVQSAGTAAGASRRDHLAGKVENVHATVPGRRSTGTVILVAHYDSAPKSPGASDDGIGVSALLEIARVLTAGPRPRNDVVLLFTDGEERGLLGAHAYLHGGQAPSPDRSVVLNLEARGTSGPVLMFETGPGGRRLVSSLRHAPPFTTSVADEVYRRLPNDTDFTEFRDAGFTGMNFAIVGGGARYHTAEDSIRNFSQDSLQDMGTVVLAATRELARSDLGAARGPDAVFFTVFGQLVVYPGWLALPLALAGIAAFAAALWWSRRRERIRPREVAIGAASLPLPLLASAVVGWAGWTVLAMARPGYGTLPTGEPYRAGPLAAGLALLAAAPALAWIFKARRRLRTPELIATVTGWLCLLSVLTALVVPGAHYLFTLPALAGTVAFLPFAVRGWRMAAGALFAATTIVLVVPFAVLLFPVLGLPLGMAPLVLLTLSGLAGAPLVARLPRPRVAVAVCAVAGVLVLGAGAVRDTADARHPAHVSLAYLVDADRGTARWASESSGPAWVDRRTPGRSTNLEDDFPALLAPGGYRTGPAPIAPVPAPAVSKATVKDVAPGVREFRVRVTIGPGKASVLGVYLDVRRQTVEAARVDGAAVHGGRNRPFADGAWKWGVEFAGPGERVDLALRIKGPGPVRMRLTAETGTVPAAALGTALPADLTWSAIDSGKTLVARTHTL
ncbi:M28 family peptidase [Actinomadura sp. 9N215]|uniref:M28 family peptidase n=1 Tax=Actinomadura sp. 9N215 TaxID=3375150 RepID=UPI00378A6DBB